MGDLEIEVVIHEAAFAEASHHFVAIQLNQDPKVRTEVTSATKNPRFYGSSFTFILEGALDQDRVIEDVLHFALFEVNLKKGQNDTARYIGGGCLSLYEITDQVVTEGTAEATVVLSHLPRGGGGESVEVGELYLEVVEKAIHPPRSWDGTSSGVTGAGVVGGRGGGNGCLRVQILGAYNLPPGDDGNTYVEVWLSEDQTSPQVNGDGSGSGSGGDNGGGNSHALVGRTRAAPNPNWNETMYIDPPPSSSSSPWTDYAALIFRLFHGVEPTQDQPVASQRVMSLALLTSSSGPQLLALECEPAGLLLVTVEVCSSHVKGPGVIDLSNHALEWPEEEIPPQQPLAYLQLMRATEADALATSIAAEETVSLPFIWWSAQQQDPPPLPTRPSGNYPTLLTGGQITDDKLCWTEKSSLPLPTDNDDDWVCVVRFLSDLNTLKIEDPRQTPPPEYSSNPTITSYELLFEPFAYALLPLPGLAKCASRSAVAETLAVLRLAAASGDVPWEGGHSLNVTYRATATGVVNRGYKRPAPPPAPTKTAELDSQSTWDKVDISQMDKEDVEERPLTADMEISPLERRLLALTDELSKKDSVIEGLGNELDQQAEAIRRCGTEILKLRQGKQEAENTRDAIKKRLQDSERDLERASSLVVCEDGEKLNKASLPELQRVLPVLVKRYHGVRLEKDKLMQRVHAMAQDVQSYTVLKAAFAKLQRAHLGQSAYIQTLQSKQSRIETYKTTIKMQDKVIQRLEELLEAKLQRPRSQQDETPRSTADPTPRGVARGAALDALKDEISRLRAENDDLRNEAVVAHEMAAAAKELRIKAVEEELIEQSRASAKEITDLKMRIFELENGLAKDGLTKPLDYRDEASATTNAAAWQTAAGADLSNCGGLGTTTRT